MKRIERYWCYDAGDYCDSLDVSELEVDLEEANTFLDAAVIARDKFGGRICELEEERDELREALHYLLQYSSWQTLLRLGADCDLHDSETKAKSLLTYTGEGGE